MPITPAQFTDHLQDALARLYDPPALAATPLARGAGEGNGHLPSASGAAAALRQELIAAIEMLKPGPQVDPNARIARPYRVLQLRYVEGVEATEVQGRLAISKSQYYRDHEAALASLAGLLWERGWADRLTPNGTAERAAPTGGQTAHRGQGASAVALPARSGAAWRWRTAAAGVLGVFAVAWVLFLRGRAPLLPVAANTGSATGITRAGAPTAAPAGAAPGSSTGSATAAAAVLSVYAGDGQPGHVNGAAASARFSGQFGLAVDNAGFLVVADTGNHRLRHISTSGLVLDLAGSGTEGYADGPAAEARFASPNAVTVGPDGTVYVGDAGNLRIRAISPSGVVSTLAGSGVAGYVDGVGTAASFTTTGAIVADRAGNTYVPDPNNNVIRKITPAGVVTTYAGSGTRGHLDGRPDSAQFNAPTRMGGVDAAGSVYVLDLGDSRIRKISPDGTVTTVAGTGTPGFADGPVVQAQFSTNILGVITDAAGTLFVMDAGNRRVRQVTPDGIVSTLYEFTNPDQTPGNIKVDQGGNLFLSDRQHNVIYKLTLQRGTASR